MSGEKKRRMGMLWIWSMFVVVVLIVAYANHSIKTAQADQINAVYLEISTLKAELENLNAQYSKLEYEYNKLKEENRALRAENEKLREEIASLELQQGVTKLKLMQLTQLSMNLSENISKVRFELYDASQSLERRLEELSVTIQTLNETIENTIKPPYTKKEIYSGGAALVFDKHIAPLIKNSELSAYNIKLDPSDWIYIAPPVSSIQKLEHFFNWTKIPQEEYLIELHDCDDFAWALYAEMKRYYPEIAFGVAFTKHHAFNVIVLWDGEKPQLYVVEPQAGKIIPLEKAKQIEINGIKPYDGIYYVVM